MTKIRILGVFFSNGLVSVDDDNWKVKLNKLSCTLGLWKQRDLSFVGRSLIVNVLGASRLWHVAKVLPPPSWFFYHFKSIVWPFIWNGKWKMLVDSVVVRRLRLVASALSTLLLSVLAYVFLIFLVCAMSSVPVSGIILRVIF